MLNETPTRVRGVAAALAVMSCAAGAATQVPANEAGVRITLRGIASGQITFASAAVPSASTTRAS